MIEAKVEYLKDTLHELMGLLPKHWEELALNKDKVPLDPNYPLYIKLEEMGFMHTIVLREDGKAIGYVNGIISPHLHYMTCITFMMDILYIDKEHRGNSSGDLLMEKLFEHLKSKGVRRAVFNTKLHHNIGKFFEKHGCTHIENLYSIWLGD